MDTERFWNGCPADTMNQAVRITFNKACILLPIMLMSSSTISRCALGDETSAATVLQDLFEDDVLSDNVFKLLQSIKDLPAEVRYERLRLHVIPGKSHDEFRLFGKMTPTDPPESGVDAYPIDVARVHAGTLLNQRRIRTGGIFVSPVLDLIDAAKETGKLDELRLATRAATVHSEVQRRCQLSMLAMIAIVQGDLDNAMVSTDELYKRFLKQRFDRLQDRMPETLLLYVAVNHDVLLDEALLFLISIQDSQIRAGKTHGPAEWDVLIMNLVGRIQYQKLAPEKRNQPWTAAPELQAWHWVTRCHSWSNGLGLAIGHMQVNGATVDVLSKMDDEFLLFTSPLRGNYTLECQCTGFGWKEIYPLINGSWITPAHHYESVQVGEMYRPDLEIKVMPKLSRVDDWIHYRVDLRDGVCSRYINSRLISCETLPREHDPWVAIRNPSSGAGSVRNLRLTGEPVVPDEVKISELRSRAWIAAENVTDIATQSTTPVQSPISHLLGWIPWHEDPWHPDNLSWKLEQDSAGVTQIVGDHNADLSGTGTERMLRYVWPLVWDSEVGYEFFCEDKRSIVHPVLGRRALLLERTGVKTHWVANHIWDDSGLDPLNVSESDNRVAIESLPLKSGEWNRMTLQVSGDVLRLRLNNVIILESDIAATNDRTFGLFYFCDQSEARVRNVVLKGDWPNFVPPVAEQELRGTETDKLDQERDALPESFEFDFTKTTQQEVQSAFAESFDEPGSTALQPDGLRMSGTARPKGQSTSALGPRTIISGDFDVTAEFANLNLKVSDNGSCAIYLGPRVIQEQFEAHLLYRGMIQHPGTPQREITQVEVLQSGAKGFRYSYPAIYAEECRSGRLRLARRGTMFHYLIAPLDSASYHLLHSMEASDIPIQSGAFLLRTSCYSQGDESSEVSVVWKSLSVRAESIEQTHIPGTTVLRNLYVLDLPNSISPPAPVTTKTGIVQSFRKIVGANQIFSQLKWPTWTPDGTSIIYEMNNGPNSILFRVVADGTEIRQLGIGTLPGVSPEDSQIVTSVDGLGVLIMPATGGAVTANLDPTGISAQWSPDGRFIAWISKKRIVLLDVKTDQRRVIPAEDQPLPYRAIEKGLAWSRDSKSLAFKAKLLKDEADAAAIVVMDLDKPDKLHVLYTAVRLHSDVSWHPDGNQILFSGLDPSTGTPQMFIVKRTEPQTAIPVQGQPRKWRIIDCDWSPDGQKIAFTAEPSQEENEPRSE